MACPVGFMVSVVCCGEALLVYPRSSTGRAATFIIFSQGAVIFSEAQNKDENVSKEQLGSYRSCSSAPGVRFLCCKTDGSE